MLRRSSLDSDRIQYIVKDAWCGVRNRGSKRFDVCSLDQMLHRQSTARRRQYHAETTCHRAAFVDLCWSIRRPQAINSVPFYRARSQVPNLDRPASQCAKDSQRPLTPGPKNRGPVVHRELASVSRRRRDDRHPASRLLALPRNRMSP